MVNRRNLLVLIGSIGTSGCIQSKTSNALSSSRILSIRRSWEMHLGNSSHTGTIEGVPTGEPVEYWSQEVSGPPPQRMPQPVVRDGVVYVITRNGVWAFDAENGSQRWKTDVNIENEVSHTPVVTESELVVSGSHLRAFDVATGKKTWAIDESATNGDQATPVLSDGMVYVGTEDVGGLHAVTASDGKIQWHIDTAAIEVAPAVSGGVVYVADLRGNLYALNATDGTTQWTQTLQNGVSESTPTIVGDTLYVGDDEGRLYAFEVASGTQRWRNQISNRPLFSPTAFEDSVYVADDRGIVYFLSASDGSIQRRIESGSTTDRTQADFSVLHSGHEVVVNRTRRVAVLQAKNTEWSFRFDKHSLAPPVVVNGVVFCYDGYTLYALGSRES